MKRRLGWRAVSARRSVHPWCREPVHELDPEPHAHPVLSPSPAGAGARILEFDIVGSSPAPHLCEEGIMEVLHPRCAGLDVHRDSVVACARVAGRGRLEHRLETFGTTTSELERLSRWLAGHRVTHVAMEATGVYWKPVWAVLAEAFELVLANAMHVKNVPGRKTDVNDAAWLADLLAHGLRSEEHTSELQSRQYLVCRLLLEKKKQK